MAARWQAGREDGIHDGGVAAHNFNVQAPDRENY